MSTPPSKKQLSICNFIAEKDDGLGRKGKNYYQFENARRQAQNRGFINISEAEIKGKGHEPLPGEVIRFFYQLLTSSDNQ